MAGMLRTLGVGLALAVLIGCKSPPPPAKPVIVKFALNASATANPDSQSRASPVVVRVYQLKDDEAFKSTDFFALFDREQSVLQASLVTRSEFELSPGESHMMQTELPPEVHFLGVVAAFRDIRSARWRDEIAVPVKPAEKKPKQITLDVSVIVDRASIGIGYR